MGKKKKKEEQSFQDLWNNIKRFNIPAARVPEGKRDGDRKNRGEIMAENLPNLVKDINLQIQEVQRTANKINSRKQHSQAAPIPKPEVILKPAIGKEHFGYRTIKRMMARRHVSTLLKATRKRTVNKESYIQ